MYFDQLLLAARQVNVVYSDQLVGAAHYIHFISNHDTVILFLSAICLSVFFVSRGLVLIVVWQLCRREEDIKVCWDLLGQTFFSIPKKTFFFNPC